MSELQRLLVECLVCGHRAALQVDRIDEDEPITPGSVHHLHDRLFCGECGAKEVRISDAAGSDPPRPGPAGDPPEGPTLPSMAAPDELSRRHRRHHAQRHESVAVAVITASDTRTLETDDSGRLLAAGLEATGHRVVLRRVVPDEPKAIGAALDEALAAARVVLTTGGTGVAPRDCTFEVASRRFDKTLDGFGELFRMLSWDEVGPAAILSRATAGVVGETAVFVLPGSTGAVRLALERLILPELGHLAWLLAPEEGGP